MGLLESAGSPVALLGAVRSYVRVNADFHVSMCLVCFFPSPVGCCKSCLGTEIEG